MVAAVVLAAGEASRFGSPKQWLLIDDVLDTLRAAPSVDEIVVVAGAHPLPAHHRATRDPDTSLVYCPEWQVGAGASLHCGLEALPADTEAAVIVLADGPDLTTDAVERVVAAWRAGAGELVAASYGGVRGHPVVAGRGAFADIPPAGLRDREPVLVACDDLGSPGDVDTHADLPDRYRVD